MAQISRVTDFIPNQPIVSGDVDAELNQLVATINALDAENLRAALATILGVSAGPTARRGKENIAAEESRAGTLTSYDWMPTPDRVQDVDLPADGLIVVAYQAMWKETQDDGANAAIFIGSNQLKRASGDDAAPLPQSTQIYNDNVGQPGAGVYKPLATCFKGLFSNSNTVTAYGGDVATGQAIGFWTSANDGPQGGVCYIFATAGTYDVGVKFKATFGNVTAKNRKLWVWTMGF